MQTFSRILVVAVTVISIAFMGFAGAASFGGPNWEAQTKKLEGYLFQRSEGENPTWSVTRMEGREQLGTTSVLLPEVFVAAMEDRKTRAEAELTRLTEEEPILQQQINEYRRMQAADYQALKQYHDADLARLDQTNKQVEEVRKQGDMVAVEVAKIEDQIESRRNDVFRLELQYRILIAEVERIRQNLDTVKEQIHLTEDELEKANRRSQALDQQGFPKP